MTTTQDGRGGSGQRQRRWATVGSSRERDTDERDARHSLSTGAYTFSSHRELRARPPEPQLARAAGKYLARLRFVVVRRPRHSDDWFWFFCPSLSPSRERVVPEILYLPVTPPPVKVVHAV